MAHKKTAKPRSFSEYWDGGSCGLTGALAPWSERRYHSGRVRKAMLDRPPHGIAAVRRGGGREARKKRRFVFLVEGVVGGWCELWRTAGQIDGAIGGIDGIACTIDLAGGSAPLTLGVQPPSATWRGASGYEMVAESHHISRFTPAPSRKSVETQTGASSAEFCMLHRTPAENPTSWPYATRARAATDRRARRTPRAHVAMAPTTVLKVLVALSCVLAGTHGLAARGAVLRPAGPTATARSSLRPPPRRSAEGRPRRGTAGE